MLRPLAERPLIGRLADEGDRPRPQLVRHRLEPLSRPGEVGGAKVARAARRPPGGVRQPAAEVEERVLLLGSEEARREACLVQKPPEVVPRVRERRSRRGRSAAGIDAAEDDLEAGSEDVRDCRAQRGRQRDGRALQDERLAQLRLPAARPAQRWRSTQSDGG